MKWRFCAKGAKPPFAGHQGLNADSAYSQPDFLKRQ